MMPHPETYNTTELEVASFLKARGHRLLGATPAGRLVEFTFADCGFRTMPISIPKRCRSGLRADADHDSDAKPITNRVGIGTVISTS
jgi:hypothetical protein